VPVHGRRHDRFLVMMAVAGRATEGVTSKDGAVFFMVGGRLLSSPPWARPSI
jgi:hypothetical protein